MPELFALGLDDALKEISGTLQEGELVFAYLDDVYLLVDRDRARGAFDEAERPRRNSAPQRMFRALRAGIKSRKSHRVQAKRIRSRGSSRRMCIYPEVEDPALALTLRWPVVPELAHLLVAGGPRAGGAASGRPPRARGTWRCVRPKPEPC